VGLPIDKGQESDGGAAEEVESLIGTGGGSKAYGVWGKGQAVADKATAPQIYEEPKMGVSAVIFLSSR
jgi:hypothetical protein